MKCIQHITLLYRQLYGKGGKKPTFFPRYAKILWWWSSGHVAGTTIGECISNLQVWCLASSKKMLCSLLTHSYKSVCNILLIYLKFDVYWNFSLSWGVLLSLYCLNNISLEAHRCKTYAACIMPEFETIYTILEEVFPSFYFLDLFWFTGRNTFNESSSFRCITWVTRYKLISWLVKLVVQIVHYRKQPVMPESFDLNY